MNSEPNTSISHPPAQLAQTKLPNGSPQIDACAEQTGSAQDVRLTGARLWAHRLAVLLFVFFCATLGVVLVVFPWRDEWWVNNSLLVGYPALQDFMSNGFVRGLCSGLGLLDIWIGFSEAVHYHE
ncbi:MAG: hypothetical protein DMG68_08230 [Acidobacteria bacterium]|nr:MAG: hypothetical protein DMG68_08230 [Acidobacteriota bacterium]